ncbi:universal stress protein [Desulfosarcina sp. OttesenSCG-928-G10]|nr:universal stress protein [Desulfosarcina sp. OttesenSCG-928-G10]MDL2321401.1 universal stress protein [Desulfosarcina sp. OttesenSCG-928-B08]
MEKKILIAVDDSRHSENAVRYVAGLHGTVQQLKYVLFHVEPTISFYLQEEAKTKPAASAELQTVMRKSHEAARAMLDRYVSVMVSLGVSGDNIQTVSLPRKFGAGKDVLEYGTAMVYDAIVIGRRGLSGMTEMLMGSVSADIVNNSQLVPVWLVDDKSTSGSVMLAVDGSESSLRAVDHVSFICGGDPDITLTFFHVEPRLSSFCPIDFGDTDISALDATIAQGDRAHIDRFFAHALKTLAAAGITERQIRVDVQKGAFRVGKAVLDAYRKGNFGTLVVGRRGMGKQFFGGSVSRFLVNQFSGGALWVVP